MVFACRNPAALHQDMVHHPMEVCCVIDMPLVHNAGKMWDTSIAYSAMPAGIKRGNCFAVEGVQWEEWYGICMQDSQLPCINLWNIDLYKCVVPLICHQCRTHVICRVGTLALHTSAMQPTFA